MLRVRDRLGVVEEPVQPVERNVVVDRLKHVERARDRFVVGGVHAQRPAVLGQDAHDALRVAFHRRRHVGPRLAEILEVGGREDEHLAGAVVAEIVVALPGLRRAASSREVVPLLLRLLREEVVGEADGELALVGAVPG